MTKEETPIPDQPPADAITEVKLPPVYDHAADADTPDKTTPEPKSTSEPIPTPEPTAGSDEAGLPVDAVTKPSRFYRLSKIAAAGTVALAAVSIAFGGHKKDIDTLRVTSAKPVATNTIYLTGEKSTSDTTPATQAPEEASTEVSTTETAETTTARVLDTEQSSASQSKESAAAKPLASPETTTLDETGGSDEEVDNNPEDGSGSEVTDNTDTSSDDDPDSHGDFGEYDDENVNYDTPTDLVNEPDPTLDAEEAEQKAKALNDALAAGESPDTTMK